MMRSLFSGVAGLKTHQTKMDVIGNNIANVNTAGFKSSSVNFSDTFYQMVSSATGPNAEFGTAGTNAKQIGLGSLVAAIQVNITEQGGPSTTNRALDVAINGEAFMIVSMNGESYFTKSGAMNVDEAGNLMCTTNGATVQGWLADKDGNVIKDRVRDLTVMNADNMYYEPEATLAVTLKGNLDPNDPDLDVNTGNGEVVTYSFFDNIGNLYTAQLAIRKAPGEEGADEGGTVEAAPGKYLVQLVDILDAKSNSVFVQKSETEGNVSYSLRPGVTVNFGGIEISSEGDYFQVDALTGKLSLTEGAQWVAESSVALNFGAKSGNFASVGNDVETGEDGQTADSIRFAITAFPGYNGGDGEETDLPFPQLTETGGGVELFFNSLTQYSQGGTSKVNYTKGNADNQLVGNAAGNMNGISVDEEGKVWGNYNNGLKKCLGQIAVATFANPSGLEAVGDSLFSASLNSGEFDGVGEEILLSGSFTVGALEMSNVDLANEFTQMITTQRGFQANSRIITTSDSMLEELVNLKR